MKVILLLTLLTSVWMHPAYAFLGLEMTPFQKACRDGADAQVQFHIVDDMGLPVANARVNVFFDMIDRSKGKRVIGCTDTNGVFIAEAKTGGVLEIEVTGDVYYKTIDKMCFIEMGNEHDVQDGKWQPWGVLKKIVLRPIKNPKARRVVSRDWRLTKNINVWLAFDFEKYDFVKPYGTGVVNDVEIKFEWDGKFGTKHNGMGVFLRFSDLFSGGYYAERFLNSSFTGVYEANKNMTYSNNFHYYRRLIRDSKGRKVGGEGEKFDKSKTLVGRTRCILDEKGNLVSAQYFQIENLELACSREKEAAIRFNLIFNPTPNDTNLEPKR